MSHSIGPIAERWWPVLQTIPLFASVGLEESDCLKEATEVHLKSGELLIREGAPPGPFFIVVSGSLHATRNLNGRPTFFMRFESGSFFGHELLLLSTNYQATAHADGDAIVLRLEEQAFWRMLQVCPSVNRSLLRTTAERARTLEAIAQHDARLISLSKLAAGLAHELNNPAAALSRSGQQLKIATSSFTRYLPELGSVGLSASTSLLYTELFSSLAARDQNVQPDFNDSREDEWDSYFETQGVAGLLHLPLALAQTDVVLQQLAWLEALPGPARRTLLGFLDSLLGLETHGEHVRNCSRRISQVVTAVKSYTLLDQEAVQTIDVNASIRQAMTLVSLSLSPAIAISAELSDDLNTIEGPALELNLVWSALLENARAALSPGGGNIVIRSSQDGPSIRIEVTDDGCGIPHDLQDRLFEPFFTTRDVGKGVGLGLFMSRRIIMERFHGDIRIESTRGHTKVDVFLPSP